MGNAAILSDLKERFRVALNRLGGLSCGANNYDRLHNDKEPSRRELERVTGRKWSEIKRWALSEDEEIREKVELPDEDVKYRALIEQNRRLSDSLSKARDVSDTIISCCLSQIAKLKIKPVPIPKKHDTKESLEMHLMRSDAQVGQYTDERYVQGLARYDSAIYRERIERLTDKILTFKDQDCRSLGLNKLVIPWLGDQVDGEAIFPGQSFALDLAAVDQVFYSIEIEGNNILRLAQSFNEIEIFCVPGNHGRPGKPGANNPRTNFDYIFYRILKMVLEQQENIKVYVSESPSMLIQNGAFNFLLNHGDNAKSWAGIPFYGLDRVSKRVHELYNMIIHYNLCGHHHIPCNIADRSIMNGCIPGGSDFSVNRLTAASRPSQKMFYFHPTFGINRESNLYLADPVQLSPDENGIYTAYHKDVEERPI